MEIMGFERKRRAESGLKVSERGCPKEG